MGDQQGSVLARWLGVLRLSRRQLQQRWLESVLIMLGIALGVGVLTAGETFVRFQTSMVEDVMGSVAPEWRAVTVTPRLAGPAQEFSGPNSVPAVRIAPELMEEPAEISVADVLTMRSDVPGVAYVTLGSGGTRGFPLVAVGEEAAPEDASVLVQSVTPDEFAFQGLEFVAGGPFTWDDFSAGEPRIVLDADSVARVLPDMDPADLVGASLAAGSASAEGGSGARWRITGVARRSEDDLWSRLLLLEQEPNAVLAYQPATARPWSGAAGDQTFPRLYVSPRDEEALPELIAEIEAYFAQKYGAGRVEVRNPLDERSQLTAEFGPFIIALLVLAGLGLVIAAINVLNLFTARVLRRQRITGMSIALGATRRLLFWQTAGEALLLGATGSGLGLALASALVAVVRSGLTVGAAQAGDLELELYAGFRLGAPDVLVGLAAGIGLSLIFGLYPAWLASRQDPAEALRVE